MQTKTTTYCEVCERDDHNHRTHKGQKECPARVIRIMAEPGSCIPASDPGTR